jgi:hypothetical protein
MEQGPSSEVGSRSAGQEIPRLLRNTTVHYRVNKTLALDSILMNIAHILTMFI